MKMQMTLSPSLRARSTTWLLLSLPSVTQTCLMWFTTPQPSPLLSQNPSWLLQRSQRMDWLSSSRRQYVNAGVHWVESLQSERGKPLIKSRLGFVQLRCQPFKFSSTVPMSFHILSCSYADLTILIKTTATQRWTHFCCYYLIIWF